MITLKMGELYGMESEKDLVQTIKELQDMGMSDDDIQAVLDRSKEENKSGLWNQP